MFDRSLRISLFFRRPISSLHLQLVDGFDPFKWNVLIRSNSRSENPENSILIYKEMIRSNVIPNSHTYPSLFNGIIRCNASSTVGKSFHAHLYKFGLECNIFVLNSLMNMYKCLAGHDGLSLVQNLFDEMSNRDVISWNVMMGVLVRWKLYERVFLLFHRMIENNLMANEVTVVALLSTCSNMKDLELGRWIHGYIKDNHISVNVIVGNSLIDMYSKCGSIEESRLVFDGLVAQRNVISWNSMISGYCRAGLMDIARDLFDKMPERNIISWTSMMSGFVQNNRPLDALHCFVRMKIEGEEHDEVLLTSLLSACADLGALSHGKSIHTRLHKYGLPLNSIMGSAVIDMYAKCGKIDLASRVFHGAAEKDVNPWTSMITGLALHGQGRTCLELFSMMELENICPNEVTFMGVICGCSHARLIDAGFYYFNRMRTVYKISPQIEHYGCMVDLLGRAGLLEEALTFINTMPIAANCVIWGALLGGCQIHGNAEIGIRAATVLIELEPFHSGRYSLLSNMYASVHQWDEANRVRQLMKDRGVEKETGLSWIEVDGMISQFSSGDRSHVRLNEINSMLEIINSDLKSTDHEELSKSEVKLSSY